jgi:type II pantothenate kinase
MYLLAAAAAACVGRLHFVKFETGRVEDAIAFIEAKGLHRFQGKDGQGREMRVKATGK